MFYKISYVNQLVKLKKIKKINPLKIDVHATLHKAD